MLLGEVIGMRKTMIYLKDNQFLMLKQAAASSGKKMSGIIREVLSRKKAGSTAFPL
jgi:hypothetical protein